MKEQHEKSLKERQDKKAARTERQELDELKALRHKYSFKPYLEYARQVTRMLELMNKYRQEIK